MCLAQTFSSGAAATFGRDQLPPQLGQLCLQLPKMVAGGFIFLSASHLFHSLVIDKEKFVTSDSMSSIF